MCVFGFILGSGPGRRHGISVTRTFLPTKCAQHGAECRENRLPADKPPELFRMTNIEAPVGVACTAVAQRTSSRACARYQFGNWARVPLYDASNQLFGQIVGGTCCYRVHRPTGIEYATGVCILERVRSAESNFRGSDWKLRGCVLSAKFHLIVVLRKPTVTCVCCSKEIVSCQNLGTRGAMMETRFTAHVVNCRW